MVGYCILSRLLLNESTQTHSRTHTHTVFAIRLNFFSSSFHLILIVVLLLVLVMVLLSIFRSLPIVTLGVVCSFVRSCFFFADFGALLLSYSTQVFLHHFKADTLIRMWTVLNRNQCLKLQYNFPFDSYTRFQLQAASAVYRYHFSCAPSVCVCVFCISYFFFPSFKCQCDAMKWIQSKYSFFFSMQWSKSEVFCSCFSFIPIFSRSM